MAPSRLARAGVLGRPEVAAAGAAGAAAGGGGGDAAAGAVGRAGGAGGAAGAAAGAGGRGGGGGGAGDVLRELLVLSLLLLLLLGTVVAEVTGAGAAAADAVDGCSSMMARLLVTAPRVFTLMRRELARTDPLLLPGAPLAVTPPLLPLLLLAGEKSPVSLGLFSIRSEVGAIPYIIID
jgi:hypothetical protein